MSLQKPLLKTRIYRVLSASFLPRIYAMWVDSYFSPLVSCYECDSTFARICAAANVNDGSKSYKDLTIRLGSVVSIKVFRYRVYYRYCPVCIIASWYGEWSGDPDQYETKRAYELIESVTDYVAWSGAPCSDCPNMVKCMTVSALHA